jgi:hypothetical protein
VSASTQNQALKEEEWLSLQIAHLALQIEN